MVSWSQGELVYYDELADIKDSNGKFLGASGGLQSQVLNIGSVDERQPWRLQRFLPYDARSESWLKAGDLVRLFHTEEEAFLMANIDDYSIRDDDELEMTDYKNEKLEALFERL